MLEVKDLGVQLGSFSLKSINLDVRDEEYFVLLGRTGSTSIARGDAWRSATSMP